VKPVNVDELLSRFLEQCVPGGCPKRPPKAEDPRTKRKAIRTTRKIGGKDVAYRPHDPEHRRMLSRYFERRKDGEVEAQDTRHATKALAEQLPLMDDQESPPAPSVKKDLATRVNRWLRDLEIEAATDPVAAWLLEAARVLGKPIEAGQSVAASRPSSGAASKT